MTTTRRRLLQQGGLAAALFPFLRMAKAGGAVDIRMEGRADGSKVWYNPIGLKLAPGANVRWINLDPSDAHTATAYHPILMDRPRRIPEKAKPWNSDYLLPDESFVVTLTEPGVYDFYCIPHEHAGMVGRIIVDDGKTAPRLPAEGRDIPEAALGAFPSIEEIMTKGIVLPV